MRRIAFPVAGLTLPASGIRVPEGDMTRKKGTIGRICHHGIHGHGNRNVKIKNVDFEVAALALNGVEGLKVVDSTARNREDVHVIGSYSNARFIAPYLD